MMFPWVVLGVVLIISLFVAVIVTSISLFLDDDELYHVELGFLYLVIGLIAVREYKVIFTNLFRKVIFN